MLIHPSPDSRGRGWRRVDTPLPRLAGP